MELDEVKSRLRLIKVELCEKCEADRIICPVCADMQALDKALLLVEIAEEVKKKV